jgi:nitrite reductase/ring-hydroxylating ferredoxin subunit
MLIMNEKFVKVVKAGEIAPGGMKPFELEGKEIVICNNFGKYYAFQRRCGHMNSPLDMGTLDGIYLTCAMHCAQFDVSTGEALSGPVPADFGNEIPPPGIDQYLQNIGTLMNQIQTESIRTYETKIESGWVYIALSALTQSDIR